MSTSPPANAGSSSGSQEEFQGQPSCPYCGADNAMLVPIDAGMRLRLQQHAKLDQVPDSVCSGCHRQMTKLASKGATLRQEAQRKEQNRLLLWKGRVNIVKQAKLLLAQKNYSDAAVAYEKYIRVLEIVHEAKPGALSPDSFKHDARKQELTVVAGVYWDLMRIYDTSPRYGDRQMAAAKKLAEFVRFSAIYPIIIRKAESQSRTAKNPGAFKAFLKLSSQSRPRCFIATAAFESPWDPIILDLCDFRDQQLMPTFWGRTFVRFYYTVSPTFARGLDLLPLLKAPTRKTLTWFVRHVVVKANSYGTKQSSKDC